MPTIHRCFALFCPERAASFARWLLVSATLIVTGTLCKPARAQQTPIPDVSPQDRVLLEEVDNLVSKLGPFLWQDWKGFPPFLIRRGGQEYLIGHPHPPEDFHPSASEILNKRVWVRVAKDTSDIQASYPLNGVMTAMMSAPTPTDNAYVWVLTAAHETFHCYQGQSPGHSPFVGKFAEYNDLTFPFPYDDKTVMAALRLEAETVFRLASASSDDKESLIAQSRLLPLNSRIESALYTAPEFQDYKLLTEWKEGVARYTERELARLAATAGRYEPAPPFAQMFPASSYSTVWREEYGDAPMLNPIRFVGEGVQGRVMFYYLGMGKAYALDHMNPKWRALYKTASLDDLLQQASTDLSR
jgi:hypothetical protein